MSPLLPDEVEQVARQIEDTLVSTEKVRDGLRDDDAIPFVEWGLARARQIAARMAAPEHPPPDEEQISGKAYALARLMTRLNWLVTYRNKKDATWLERTFAMVNKLSQELYGEDAPVFSDTEIAAWIAGHAPRSDGELLRDLIQRLTPPAADAPSPPPDSPPDTSPDTVPEALPGRPTPTAPPAIPSLPPADSTSLQPGAQDGQPQQPPPSPPFFLDDHE